MTPIAAEANHETSATITKLFPGENDATTAHERLLMVAKRWLRLEDTEVLDILLATVVAHWIPGDPTWLLLVKPSGAGGTELLTSIQGDFVYPLSTLTPRTLVSGLNTGDNKQQGILQDLDDKIVIVKDFTSLLTMNSDDARRVFADLRESHDPDGLSKAYGSGVKTQAIKSRFTIMAAVTPIIERHRKLVGVMGDRWLWLRFNPDAMDCIEQALDNEGDEAGMRGELRGAISATIEEAKQRVALIRDIDPKIKAQLVSLAHVTAVLRTPVIRNHSGTIDYDPRPEVGTRIVKGFMRLLKALTAVRGLDAPSQSEIDAILRVAGDTIPTYRLRIVERLYQRGRSGVTEASRTLCIPAGTVKNELEELQALGVTHFEGEDRNTVWLLDDGMAEALSKSGLLTSKVPPAHVNNTGRENRESAA